MNGRGPRLKRAESWQHDIAVSLPFESTHTRMPRPVIAAAPYRGCAMACTSPAILAQSESVGRGCVWIADPRAFTIGR